MPSKKSVIGIPWSFRNIWNKILDEQPAKPLVPRDYIYASELGGAFCDRYLKMYGVPMTNPPNFRSRRKFQAGNTWEWLVGVLLVVSGMMQKKQLRVDVKLPRLLRVSGRLDFVAGGEINWGAAKEKLKTFQEYLSLIDAEAPPFFFDVIDRFIEKYKNNFLAEYILEAKSISSYMMEKVQKTGAMSHHVLQNFHYLYGNEDGIRGAKLLYICKDDCIMEEFDITEEKSVFDVYKEDVRLMTKYYNAGFNRQVPLELMPGKEPEVFFEEGTWRFVKNWKVEYSNYLTLLYGYETPEQYGKFKWQRTLASWNRVFKRCVRGDNITPKNKEVIAQASRLFPQWDKYVGKAKKDGAFRKPEELGEEDVE
jgi:hypothetical protein